MALSFTLEEKDKEFLGQQAITAIETGLAGDQSRLPAKPQANGVLSRDLGSFVTLKKHGNLRGCIGTIIGREPLYLNVWNMAQAAAFEDPRFPPLEQSEWPQVDLEITVLDQPTRCPDPSEIEIGRDGLILSWHGRNGVFLPQVPVEQGWDVQAYLINLCYKAGVPAGAWQAPDAQLYWYQALAFPVAKKQNNA